MEGKTQRDPIFRAAADAAAHSAAEQINQLGGQTHGKFLSGLANDLGETHLSDRSKRTLDAGRQTQMVVAQNNSASR